MTDFETNRDDTEWEALYHVERSILLIFGNLSK